jgi:hypothetical protein
MAFDAAGRQLWIAGRDAAGRAALQGISIDHPRDEPVAGAAIALDTEIISMAIAADPNGSASRYLVAVDREGVVSRRRIAAGRIDRPQSLAFAGARPVALTSTARGGFFIATEPLPAAAAGGDPMRYSLFELTPAPLETR